MIEKDWQACIDPMPMLEFMRGKASERKLRLFACACCRRAWDILSDKRSRNTIEVAEAYVDGLAAKHQLDSASEGAQDASHYFDDIAATADHNAPDYDHGYVCCHSDAATAAWEASSTYPTFHSAFAGASRYVSRAAAAHAAWDHDTYYNTDFHAPVPETDNAFLIARRDEHIAQSHLLRDILGNPFRSVSCEPAWLTWNDGAIRKMAQAIYDDRAFDRLPLLADALEDASCDDAEILSHCRSGGEHVRGCWVVDLLLGKA